MHTTIRANTQRSIALCTADQRILPRGYAEWVAGRTGSVESRTASREDTLPMSHLYVTLSDAMAESKSGRDGKPKRT